MASFEKIRRAWLLIRRGHWRVLWRTVSTRIYSDQVSFGLHRDLAFSQNVINADIPVYVRPFHAEDRAALLDPDTSGLSGEEMHQRLSLVNMLRLHISAPYVGCTADGTPCHIQWLVPPEGDEASSAYVRDFLPHPNSGEFLVDGVFTLENHRGQHIMVRALSETARIAAEHGAHSLMAFVHEANTASLRGFKRAGYVPVCLRTVRWRFLRSHAVLTPLPAGTPIARIAMTVFDPVSANR